MRQWDQNYPAGTLISTIFNDACVNFIVVRTSEYPHSRMTRNEQQKMWKEAVEDNFKAPFGISMQGLGKTTRNPAGSATLRAEI
jgi:hypothetical protein